MAHIDSCSSASVVTSGVKVLNAVTWIDKAQRVVKKPVIYILTVYLLNFCNFFMYQHIILDNPEFLLIQQNFSICWMVGLLRFHSM